jgi:ribosomal protein S14
MLKLIRKDKKIRKLFGCVDQKHLIVKTIRKNTLLKNSLRLNSNSIQSNIFLYNTSKHRSVKRCVYTGRKSTIHKYFRMSRLYFFKIARLGIINGIKKVSW